MTQEQDREDRTSVVGMVNGLLLLLILFIIGLWPIRAGLGGFGPGANNVLSSGVADSVSPVLALSPASAPSAASVPITLASVDLAAAQSGASTPASAALTAAQSEASTPASADLAVAQSGASTPASADLAAAQSGASAPASTDLAVAQSEASMPTITSAAPLASARSGAASANGANITTGPGLVTFYFAASSAALAPGAQRALADIVHNVAAGRRAMISGYHDATGNPAFNEALAKRRAQAVRKALESLGVSDDKIELHKPQITTGTGTNAQARRVEVTLQ
ncbi:MAG: OmpA family protein [Burkholderiaceae bacterium]|jgi:outer membrane protein OmpA-like peptidoglycan-associated protein|nr:OmpA family protein [Burkholderiaceae bacterium]